MSILDTILKKLNLFADKDSKNAEQAANEDLSLSPDQRIEFLNAFVRAKNDIESFKETYPSINITRIFEIGPLMRGMSTEYQPSSEIIQIWPQISYLIRFPTKPKKFGTNLGILVGLMRFRPLIPLNMGRQFILAVIGLRDKRTYYERVVRPLIQDWKHKAKNYVDFLERSEESIKEKEYSRNPAVSSYPKNFEQICAQLGI